MWKQLGVYIYTVGFLFVHLCHSTPQSVLLEHSKSLPIGRVGHQRIRDFRRTKSDTSHSHRTSNVLKITPSPHDATDFEKLTVVSHAPLPNSMSHTGSYVAIKLELESEYPSLVADNFEHLVDVQCYEQEGSSEIVMDARFLAAPPIKSVPTPFLLLLGPSWDCRNKSEVQFFIVRYIESSPASSFMFTLVGTPISLAEAKIKSYSTNVDIIQSNIRSQSRLKKRAKSFPLQHNLNYDPKTGKAVMPINFSDDDDGLDFTCDECYIKGSSILSWQLAGQVKKADNGSRNDEVSWEWKMNGDMDTVAAYDLEASGYSILYRSTPPLVEIPLGPLYLPGLYNFGFSFSLYAYVSAIVSDVTVASMQFTGSLPNYEIKLSKPKNKWKPSLSSSFKPKYNAQFSGFPQDTGFNFSVGLSPSLDLGFDILGLISYTNSVGLTLGMTLEAYQGTEESKDEESENEDSENEESEDEDAKDTSPSAESQSQTPSHSPNSVNPVLDFPRPRWFSAPTATATPTLTSTDQTTATSVSSSTPSSTPLPHFKCKTNETQLLPFYDIGVQVSMSLKVPFLDRISEFLGTSDIQPGWSLGRSKNILMCEKCYLCVGAKLIPKVKEIKASIGGKDWNQNVEKVKEKKKEKEKKKDSTDTVIKSQKDTNTPNSLQIETSKPTIKTENQNPEPRDVLSIWDRLWFGSRT